MPPIIHLKDFVMKHSLFSTLLLAGACMLLFSCEVDIPDIDTEDPEFAFLIQGPGINKTYTEETDFSSFQLNLKSNATYNFTYTGSDDGGVSSISWYVGTPMTFEDVVPGDVTISPFQLGILLNLVGDENDPVSGLGMAGDALTGAGNIVFQWQFLVRDYGGTGGPPNETSRTMNVAVFNSGPFGEVSL